MKNAERRDSFFRTCPASDSPIDEARSFIEAWEKTAHR